MSSYFKTVGVELKDWKKALLVVIFTVARLIYGWSWTSSGFGKLTTWFSDGKLNSVGKINTMVTNLAGPEVTRFDPLYINKVFAWIADNIFAGMPAVTDVLVVVLEILVGIAVILGFRIFWSALVATFLNIQFIAGASFNNFGYIWTNLAFMKFAKYVDFLGIDGYLRASRGDSTVQNSKAIPSRQV